MCNCNSRMCMHALMLYSLCDGVFNAFFAFDAAAIHAFIYPFLLRLSPNSPKYHYVEWVKNIKVQAAHNSPWENWSRKLSTISIQVHSCYQLTTLHEISHQQLAQNEKFSFHFTNSPLIIVVAHPHDVDDDDSRQWWHEMRNSLLQSLFCIHSTRNMQTNFLNSYLSWLQDSE